MGERTLDEQPTSEEIDQIAALIGQSVRDGAVGYSCNRLIAHTMPDGRPIPGTFAKEEELGAISKAVGENGGFQQFALNYRPLAGDDDDKLAEEMTILKNQLSMAGTRLLFSAPQRPGDGISNAYQPYIEDMLGAGMDVTAVTMPRSGGYISGLQTDMLPGAGPSWKELRQMDFDARLAALRDSNFRNRLIEDVRNAKQVNGLARRMYWISGEDRPAYMQSDDQSLLALAKAAGEHPAETWIRYQLDSNGRGIFHIRFFNLDLESLPGFLKADWMLPGIGDAGAHVSFISDAGWPTFVLSYWHRDRGEFTLEESIQMMTSGPMRVLGFIDRGPLSHLIQKVLGYRNTIVNGEVILEDD